MLTTLASVGTLGSGCAPSGPAPTVTSQNPVLGQVVFMSGSNAPPNAAVEVFLSVPMQTATLPNGCPVYVDPTGLILIGTLAMELPPVSGLRHLGYVPEEDKHAALAGAAAVVCSSAYESLSIALLEGFAVKTPGLVNAASPVLKEHCLRSNGGLFYGDGDEFVEALDRLVRDRDLGRALATAGHRYVTEHYRWDVVLDRYRTLINAAAG